MAKVGFATKVLSNHHYLNEVPVEGKKSSRFHFIIGRYDFYVPQIIRTGNCITLLSNPTPITHSSFWNPNHFEDLVKYVFWTFNQSFRLILLEEMETLNPTVSRRCLQLIEKHLKPYDESLKSTGHEELQWCFVKNAFLQNDPKFEQMYRLDQENRKTIREALARKYSRSGFTWITIRQDLHKPKMPYSLVQNTRIAAISTTVLKTSMTF
jgi:hypothetical protein